MIIIYSNLFVVIISKELSEELPDSVVLENYDNVVSKSNKEASSYYDFYKILSQENYELGKSVSEFIEEFKKTYSDEAIASKIIPKQVIDSYIHLYIIITY